MSDGPQLPDGPVLHPAAGVVLGNPDEAVLRLTLRVGPVVWMYGLWIGVVSALLAARYPRARVIAIAGVQLLALLPTPVAVIIQRRRGGETRWLTGAFLGANVFASLLSVALTGGLHSPLALAVFVNVSALFSRYGLSRAGRVAFAACCAAALAMVAVPQRWLGPPVPEPWFTIVAGLAVVVTLWIHVLYVTALRQTANAAVADAIRAREDLAEQALARARDLERVGARLSHELKNPLGAIKPLVQILRRTRSDPAAVQQLAVVESEVQRMSEIVNAHLSFARPLDRPRLAPVRLGELTISVLAALRGRAENAGVELRCRGDARVVADGQRLKEALFNLVGNAIEACGPGALVEVAIERGSDGAHLRVRDTGRGMSPEVLARVGTPFYTTREDGTGLGVVLARAVFEQHGGTLQYTSAPGEGTTVVGVLPAEP